jgi:Tfp pilus assembly protein PilN
MRAVNLLPRDEGRRKPGKTNTKHQLALVAPVLVAALIGAGYLMESSKVGSKRATLQALQEAIAQIPPPKPSSTPPVDASLVQQDRVRIAALSSALATRVAWDRILREISSVLPEDVWLTGLTAQTPGSVAAAPPPTPTTGSGPAPAAAASSGSAPLALVGYTYSQEGVARFLTRLAVIPELSMVKLQGSSLITVQGRPIVQFTINAELRTGATS